MFYIIMGPLSPVIARETEVELLTWQVRLPVKRVELWLTKHPPLILTWLGRRRVLLELKGIFKLVNSNR